MTSQYRPDIDGLRAVAVLAVVGYHAFPGWVRGGFIGVDVFFVISGYLISSILLASLEQGRFSIVEFYRRRVRRIFPALITMVATILVVGWFVLLPDEFAHLGKHIAAGAAFVSNLALYQESGYFDVAAEGKPLLHLWSLAIEEQFYIVWPLLLALVWRKRAGFLGIVLAVAALSFAANIILIGRDPSAAFFWPITRFWELMAGGALAYAHLHHPQWLQRYGHALSIAGAALLAAGFGLITAKHAFPGWWALLPVAGATLLIAAGPAAVLNRYVLSNRAMVAVGLISYPLYLWHWPLLSLAFVLEGGSPNRNTRIALVVVSFVLAYLTYILVERPVRERRRVPSRALASGMVGVLLLGLLTTTQAGFSGRDVYGVKRKPPGNYKAQAYTPITADGSCNGAALDPVLAPLCASRINPDSQVQLVILGDSQAMAMGLAAAPAAKQDGFGLTVFTNPGCPPIIGVRQTPGPAEKSACDQIGKTDRIMDAILRMKPAGVVLVARWDLYTRGFTRNGQVEKTIHFVTASPTGGATQETTLQAIRQQLPATVQRISAAGAKPLVMLNPPVLRGNVHNLRKDVAVTRQQHQDYQAVMYETLGKQSVGFLDPSATMCDARGCALYDGDGEALYTDDNHLSEAGARLLAPAVRTFLLSIAR